MQLIISTFKYNTRESPQSESSTNIILITLTQYFAVRHVSKNVKLFFAIIIQLPSVHQYSHATDGQTYSTAADMQSDQPPKTQQV